MPKPAAAKTLVPAVWIVAVMLFVVMSLAIAVLVAAGPSRYGDHDSDLAAATASRNPRAAISATTARINDAYAALPLAFEPNVGQTAAQVNYLARGNGYKLYLTNDDAVLSFDSRPSTHGLSAFHGGSQSSGPDFRLDKSPAAVVRMQFAGGNRAAHVTASDRLPGKTNYYLGNDPQKWHRGVPQYARISYKGVYPGIDVDYYGRQSKLEFDFVVAPGANAAAIGFQFTGARQISVDESGSLLISSVAGDVRLQKPVAYQERNGAREAIDARFALQAGNQVRIALGDYDHDRELVIDPSVTYATYLGGTSEDDGSGIAFDGSGNAYVTGQTSSTNFPTAGGVAPNTNAGGFDVFVTKLAADGSSLLYSTYVGGTSDDSGNALAVDSQGDVFVAGGTTSLDFPTTATAFQKTSGGGVDAFVFELNPGGTALTYSTYLGGSGDDVASSIAIDASGAYLVGSTTSTDFPTLNANQSAIAGTLNGFVTKINPTGSAELYSTYLGAGTGDFAAAVAVDSLGNAYVTGGVQTPTFTTTTGAFQTTCGSDAACNGGLFDAFVRVYNTAGTGFVYSTFLGGGGVDQGLSIAVDSAGDAYVTGLTQSTDFPLQSASQKTLGGTQDAFVAQLNPLGTALVYSTFLGGSQTDAATSIAIDANENAYVTGQTASTDFPLANPTQGTPGGGNDAFVSQFNAAGSLFFSTYLGGSLNENTNASGGNFAALGAIAVQSNGANIYVTGNTLSTDFPTHAAEQNSEAGGIDAFVVKYAVPTGPDFSISATTPVAVAPGTAGTLTVTLLSLNGYALPVNLSCSVSGTGSPAPACGASSFAPNPQTPAANPGATSTLTITTSGASAALSRPSNFLYAMWLPIAGLSLLGMSFSSAGSARKKMLGTLMIGIVMAALFLMPACGGGSSSTPPPPPCSGCTPAGSYTVTITGTDANSLTHSTTVTLTVN